MLLLVPIVSAGEITLWHAWRGEERTALEAAAEKWHAEHPDVTVRAVSVPFESLSSKLEAAIPRGNGPDLFIYAHERVDEWSRTGLILPTQAPAEGVGRQALTVNGQLWGTPLSTKCLGLFYNTGLVLAPPADTDTLVATASSLSQGDRYGLVFEAASAYAAAPWLHGAGGGVFWNGEVALDRPENVAGLARVAELARLGPAEPSGALLSQLFNEQKAAMVVNGPWFVGEIDPGVRWKVAPLPTDSATGKPAAPYASVETVFLARENPDARAFAAALPALLKSDKVDPFAGVCDRALPMPTDPAMARTWEPLARALRRL